MNILPDHKLTTIFDKFFMLGYSLTLHKEYLTDTHRLVIKLLPPYLAIYD